MLAFEVAEKTKREALADRLMNAFSDETVEILSQRLDAGDTGSIEINVKNGEPRVLKLRDWILRS